MLLGSAAKSMHWRGRSAAIREGPRCYENERLLMHLSACKKEVLQIGLCVRLPRKNGKRRANSENGVKPGRHVQCVHWFNAHASRVPRGSGW